MNQLMFRFIVLIIGFTTSLFSAESHKLTVWIRAGGTAVKPEVSAFIEKVLKSLPEDLSAEILVCTNKEDTILEELHTVTKTHSAVKVIFAQLNSFSSALTLLALNTDSESDVLTLSVGIDIRKDQIQTGLKALTDHVQVYGWSINGYENDGSCPGKGWYNTAALIDRAIVKQMQRGVPKWVDNGYLGKIDKHTIGGNEEIPIMVEALRIDPHTQFILNTSDPVFSTLQLATDISFQEKLERKMVVSNYYMEKLYRESNVQTDFEAWKKWVWESLRKE